MPKKTKLSVALEYLKKIANISYMGISDAEIVKRLRVLAKNGIEAVEKIESAEKSETESAEKK